MLRFQLYLGIFLLLSRVLLADWIPKVVRRILFLLMVMLLLVSQNFRSLLQSSTTTNNNSTVSNRTFDLNCTWSDEIFCYLDYFEHLPETEIKAFYRADEVQHLTKFSLTVCCLAKGCRSVSNQTLCEGDADCKWTKLVGSETHGCFATVLEEDLRACAFNTTPASLYYLTIDQLKH